MDAPPALPLALIGAAITLPANIKTREEFYEVIRDKRQLSVDTVAGGRYHATDVDEDDDHPWKLKSKEAMAFTMEEVLAYDAHMFNVQGKLTKTMHVHQLAALQAAYEGLEDAGIPLHEIFKTRTGVFVAGYCPFLPSVDAPDETFLRSSAMSSIADHVSYFLGTHGPSVTLETACSSSLVATALAANALSVGDCDTAIVVGINYLSEKDFHLSLQACGVLVQGPACHPFDEDGAKGFFRAEGMGCIVLRRMADAEQLGNRILVKLARAVAASAGAADSSMDGAGRVYEQPCPNGMRQMYMRAFSSAGIPFKRLNYMECHATGTAVGDVIEVDAVGSVFGESHDLETNPIRIASVKSNIGHAEVAAGIFSVIKIVQMMKHRVFLPTAGVTTPRTDYDWAANNMRVQQEIEPFPENGEPVVVGLSSFGIGGSYGHVVLEEYRAPAHLQLAKAAAAMPPAVAADANAEPTSYLLPLSAVSMAHLKLFAERMAAYLNEKKDALALKNLCGTMWVNRSRFKFRKAFIASSVEGMQQALAAFAASGNVQPSGEGRKMQVAYVFTGQGSQWPGVGKSLMAFPVYREAVEAADKIFKDLSGWSILEKNESLSADEMRDTIYAQPISFLVQVGLFELLKFFRVFPDVVTGHSAGEVAAAYAAGLLTLEEAVKVVYHRSQEQQKMAGCGRLLVVGMSHERVVECIRGQEDIEVACVNSPESVVLASSEARLNEIKSLFPEGTAMTFVQGNIAFHSSRMIPVLESIKKRLSFLDQRGETGWSLPYISTVTGKVEADVDAEYWCKNVRYPVLFQKALETAFAGDTVPDVVLEIGPHQTLVSPIKQVLGATGKAATVLPTLKKGAPCAVRFLEALGNLFERGAELDLKPWYTALGFAFEEDMPKHPFIKKPLYENLPSMRFDMRFGQYHDGPVAGRQRFFEGAFLVEVSDRTFKGMLDHRMGGKTILPGMFFVEMALEASHTAPVTLANVEFKSMCRIPVASKGEVPSMLALTFQDVKDDIRSFEVRSAPIRDKADEEPVYVTHCTGLVIKSKLLEKDGSLSKGFKPEAFGIMGGLELNDLGEAGLKDLIATHTDCKHVSKEAFYGHYCVEGVMEWLGGFQLIQSAHLEPSSKTILSKIKYDNKKWTKKGGVFGIEFLDSVIHPLLMLADDSAVYYAGGFDAGHFIRQPATEDLYCYLIPDKSRMTIGRKQKVGDFAVYDATGQLVLYIQGFFSIIGSVIDNYKLCNLLWQPYDALLSNAPLAIDVAPAAASGDEWTTEKNEDLTSFLVGELKASGALDAEPAAAPAVAPAGGRKPRGPVQRSLSEQVREAIEREGVSARASSSSALPAFPKAGGLNEVGAGLVKALAGKIKPAAAAAAAEGEAEKPVQLTGEDVEDLVAAATFQVSEASRVAATLQQTILANQQAFGDNYVFRVLELAEERVFTVFEALSLLELPASVTVEFFVGSFNSGLLLSLANKVTKRAFNIRLRRVLMSEKAEKELKDLTFDAVVLDDWVRTGSAPFAEGERADASSNAIAFLAPFLSPSAQVFVRGLNDLPLWVTLASQVSAAALPLAAATGMGSKAAREEWTSTLTLAGRATALAQGSVVAGAVKGLLTTEPGRYLLVADNMQAGTELRRRIAALNSACEAEVIVVGEGGSLSDDSTVEDYEAVINGLVGSDSSCEDSDFSEITTDSSTAAEEGASLPFKGVVFLAGLNDQSQIGETAFGRLLKLSQALLKCAEKPKSLWLVTNGVYVGEIKPAHGVVQGFSTVLKSELSGVATKHVDLAAVGTGMGPLAQLVVANAHETTYAVSEAGQILVPRFNAVDKVAARSESVLANNSKVSFFADVERQNTPGKIGAKFCLQELPAPKADEVTVDVYAAALNFRDVMIALSLLPEKSYEASFYGKNLGLEASGVVTAVGADVKNLKVGDKVLLNEPRCLTNRLNAPAYRVVPFGALTMSFEDAASIQSVFNTSHHALINLARIRKGETVLIHSAAGGIGHAAISIAKHVGAVIYATAGSEEKRQLVRDMGVTHVYNSRNTDWFDDLMRDTDGKGVDVILNSLAGKHQRLGIQALRSSGRFLEIGKMDIFDNNGLDLLAFRKNISFFAIDMDRMVLDNPALATEVAMEVGKNFEAGNYDLIPTQVFPMDKMKEALDLMKTGKHVGKIVLTNYTKVGEGAATRYEPLSVVVEKPQNVFHANATYLITGGAGGFGSAMVRYAFDHGAKHFLITTRSPNTDKVKAAFADITKHAGVTFEVLTIDTGNEVDVKTLCARAKAMSPPVKSVWHVAGVSVDVLLPEMKPENYVEVADCKARGAWFLHENTLDMGLDHFVCVSSIAALIGGPGMASYSSANAYLDALMRYRRQQGLPGTTFNMASLSDVGILKNNLSARKFQLKVGMEFMSSTRAMEMLETGLVVGLNPVITMFFKEITRDMFPSQAAWSHQLNEAISLGAVAASSSFMSAKEISAFLADEIRSITGVTTVLVTAQLTALGLDSLGFVELGGRMKKHFNVEMESVKMSPSMTLEDVAKVIYKLQARSSGAGKGEGAGAEQVEEVKVLHSKAEMNSMISSRFEARTDSGKFVPQPNKLMRMSTSSLKGSKVLVFGAEFLNGAHMVRYLIKGGVAAVYCVGPWKTNEGGLMMIEKSMRELSLWKDSFAKIIKPVPGDVAKKDFGMKGPAYEELTAEVDTIVHTGGSLKWAMDADLVPVNISGLMNVIAMARKNGASIHYLSSSSLTAMDCADPEDRDLLKTVPYFDVKRKAEDILQFAARHYNLRCVIYRLPYITPNSKGRFGTGYAKDLVMIRLMQCIHDSGLFPAKELGDYKLFLMSADAAAKFVVGHMKHTPSSARGVAMRHYVITESNYVPISALADWAEEFKGRPIDRTASVEDMKAYMGKRFKTEINFMYRSIFFEIIPALCRGGAKSDEKCKQEVTTLEYLKRRANKPRTKVGNVEALKSYVQHEPAVFEIEENYLRGEGEEVEEETKEEAPVPVETAAAGSP